MRRSILPDPPYREFDPNPRGGLRGGKGISIREDRIAIANASIVFQYDPSWNLLGLITHASCACIHDILFLNDTLWVASSQTDLLLRFDLSGKLLNYYYARELTPALEALEWNPPLSLSADQIFSGKIDFRNPSTHDKQIYNRAHLNSMCELPGGDFLISLGFVIGGRFASLLRVKTLLTGVGLWPVLMSANRQIRASFGLKKDMHSDLVVRPGGARSVVVRITPDEMKMPCLIFSDVTAPSHSLLPVVDGTVIYLNTTKGEVIHFIPQTGEILSSTKVTDGFLRGIAQVSNQRYLLGSNNEIISFDLSTQSIQARTLLSQDMKESIYDIKVLPDHYSLPPESFEEHFKRSSGYRSADIIKKGYKLPG
ncbi:MAG: hypothetical protein JXA78_10625 [Anaerolineales bacterium]|nr:hypothetical protein [Anaerolineales bacterium]